MPIHVDKNPHPDAQQAFDALHSAVESLVGDKAGVDAALRKQRQRRIVRGFRLAKTRLANAKSRTLLFLRNLFGGRWKEAFAGPRNALWVTPRRRLKQLQVRFIHAPSFYDRFLLLNEKFSQHLKSITALIIVTFWVFS